MNYTIYNTTTGQILFNTNEDAAPTDTTATIPGLYTSKQYYIDVATGQPVVLPENTISGRSRFNYETKQWDAVVIPLTEEEARAQRDQLLLAVDRVNPVWYDTLTAEQKAELIAYRQELLDVPQQEGFPEAVVWPVKPTWL